MVDNVSVDVAASANSLSVSHTTAGSDRLMIVGVSFNNDDFEVVNSVSYGATALSFIGAINRSDDSRVELWSLVNPTAATATVTVNFNEQVQQGAGVGVITFTGVDQSLPFAGFQSQQGESTTPSMNVNSVAGEVVLAVLAAERQDNNPLVTTGTQQWSYKTSNGNNRTAGTGATVAGATVSNVSWSLNETDDWVIGAISIRPSGVINALGLCDDFESGIGNWTIDASGGGDAGISGATASSGANSLFTRWQAVTVTSIAIDASTANFSLAAWVRRGADSFSEDPDQAGEGLLIEYLNNALVWTSLETFSGNGTAGEIFQRNYNLPADAHHANLRIRMSQLDGSGNDFDYWHIDDVCLSAIIQPEIEWRMDESAWIGNADEVVDSSGNNNHADIAAGSGLDTIATGQICRAGQFDGVDDYIVSGDIFALLRTTASMSFWIKTTQIGNDTGWQAPGVAGGEQNGGIDDIFWGWLDAGGRIGISVGDDYTSKSTIAINDGSFHHVVLSRDSASGNYEIYIDGQLNTSGTIGTGDIGTSFSSIGRIENSSASANYFQGDLDEVLVLDRVVSAAEVASIYNNQSTGKNLDGSHRDCPISIAAPLLNFRFEEASWNGSAGEILDYSGNGHHGQVNNNSTPETTTPALTGDPGTCGYADQNDGSIQVTGLPLDTTTIGVKTTVTLWMNWDGTNSVMPIGWNFHDIWMVGGSVGFNTWNNDVYGISSAGLAGGWHHLVFEFTNGSVASNRIFVDGVEQGLSQRTGSPNNANAFVNSQLRVGGVSNSTGYDFHGLIDEVRVYEGALTTPQVQTIMNERHPCSLSTVDHYAVTHSGVGVTCEAETVTITAHDASHVAVAPTASTIIDLSTSIANDGWTLKSGNGSFLAPNQYQFDGSESSVEFWLSKTSATSTPHIDIDVSDGSASDLDNAGSEDSALEFRDTAFRFYADAVHNSITTQIAGKASNIAPGNQLLTLAAVQTSTDTGACESVIFDAIDVEFAFSCINPASCSSRPLYLGDASPTDAVTGNNNGAPLVYGSPISLVFGSLATPAPAPLVINYPDVGEIQLHARYTIPGSGVVVSGSSNQFVSRPFGVHVEAVANPAATDHTGTIYRSAGTPFTVNVTAALWNSADDNLSGADGIPDNHDDSDPATIIDALNDNTVTLGGINYIGAPNFGQGSEGLQLSAELNLPIGGNNPSLSGGTLISSFSTGAASVSDISYNEVGIIEIAAAIADGDYLGIGASETAKITSRSGYVGRFTPAAFTVSAVTENGELEHSCAAGLFSYIGADIDYAVRPAFTVTAINALGAPTTTTNYRDAFMKLDGDSMTVAVSQDTTQLGSDSNPMSIIYSPMTMSYSSNNNGTIDFVFGADQFRYGVADGSNHIKAANSEVAPFDADIDPLLSVIDDGEVSTSLTQTFNLDSGALKHEQRFGRIRLSNAFGSELLDLRMPMRTEYFDGTAYQKNADDTCTIFADTDLSIIADNLSTPGASILSIINPTAISGDLDINLSAPGDGVVGNIELEALLDGSNSQKWLRYDWDNSGQFDNNPAATATFGIYRGEDVNIYIQQIYQ